MSRLSFDFFPTRLIQKFISSLTISQLNLSWSLLILIKRIIDQKLEKFSKVNEHTNYRETSPVERLDSLDMIITWI